MGAQLDFIKLEISRNLSLARGHHVIEEAEQRNMSVATSSIPHRTPSAGRAGCFGSLHRKLVEGRAGNQRCKKKDRKIRWNGWMVNKKKAKGNVEKKNSATFI